MLQEEYLLLNMNALLQDESEGLFSRPVRQICRDKELPLQAEPVP